MSHERSVTVQGGFFIGLLVLVSLAFVALLADFVQPIFWASIFGVIFYPLCAHIEVRLGGRASLAAFLTVLIILVTVLVPALLVGSAVIREALELYRQIQDGTIDPAAPLRWLQSWAPRGVELAARVGVDLDQLRDNLSSAAVRSSQFVAGLALSAGQNALRFGVMFVLMVYLLFFVLRDGDHILDAIIGALPLGDERERALFAKFAEVSRATIKGTLVVGLVQGTLGGIMFWALGIQGAVFWGVVMVLLSLLPAVGAGLVWAPAAVVLAAGGEWGKALVLVIFGVAVIGLVDNILRPMMVGRDTRLPDYLILFSTLGGISVFGISGFVIGPVIAALFLAVWVMFEQEHRAFLEPARAADADESGAAD